MNTAFQSFAAQFTLPPEELARLQLMDMTGTSVRSAGVTHWIDNPHSAARVTNQIVHDDLWPIDDCSEEWDQLVAWLDEFEEKNGSATRAFWFILWNPTTEEETFMAYVQD